MVVRDVLERAASFASKPDSIDARLLTACACALDATNGTAMFTEETKNRYAAKLRQRYPGFGFEFTVPFSADALAKELRAGYGGDDLRGVPGRLLP